MRRVNPGGATGDARPPAAVARMRPRRAPWRRGAAVLVPVALLGVAAVKLFDHPDAAMAAPPPPAVTVATPPVRQANDRDDHAGRFVASRTVEVRPRIAGEVTGVHFRGGEIVAKGQLLFTLDPHRYAAAFAEARAGVASAASALALARTDLDRAQRLVADEASPAGEVDAARGRVQAAQAVLAGANARARRRQLDLSATQVRAPVGGRISDRRIDPGHRVAGGKGTGGSVLTTIDVLDPAPGAHPDATDGTNP